MEFSDTERRALLSLVEKLRADNSLLFDILCLDYKRVAEVTSISYRKIKGMSAEGKLPVVYIDGMPRVRVSSLKRYLDEREVS